MTNPQRIYKVVTRAVLDASRSDLEPMPVDRADGYVHFSTAAQLRETLERHFAGQRDLALLAFDADAFGAALRWEPSRGGALFPHVYGPVPLAAIRERATIAVGADGSVTLPDWVR